MLKNLFTCLAKSWVKSAEKQDEHFCKQKVRKPLINPKIGTRLFLGTIPKSREHVPFGVKISIDPMPLPPAIRTTVSETQLKCNIIS